MLNKTIQCDVLHNKESSDMLHISLGARSFRVATWTRGGPKLVQLYRKGLAMSHEDRSSTVHKCG